MGIDFVRGAATQVGGTVLRKVAGDLKDLVKSRQQSPDSPVESISRSKYDTNHFSFPLDVESGDAGYGNHGHYMIFFINEVQPAELTFAKPKSGAEGFNHASSDYNQNGRKEVNTKNSITNPDPSNPNYYQNVGQSNDQFIERDTEEKKLTETSTEGNDQTGKSTLSIKRAPTVRLSEAITLYMPPQVQVSYAANYSDTEIGSLTKGAVDIFDTILSNNTLEGKVGKTLDSIRGATLDVATTKLLGAADALGFTGAKAAFEISKGQVISDRLELSFQGIAKRKFQYVFKMIPRNSAESQEIKRILQTFKTHMLPSFGGGDRSGRRMVVPNTFNIQYMYLGKQNKYLDPISECVLTNMSVSYGGERYRTFDPDNQGTPAPVETQVQLDFTELELITRERVLEEGEEGAFGPTNPTEAVG